MAEKFDAIIVGAGQAGPPLAGRLTEAGQTVAVIERQVVVERCPQQSIVIACGVEVILLGVKGDRAKLGVIAPEGVKVSRKETYGRRRGAH